MASSSSSHKDYDVFISFRGSDTRHGFLSHLKKELQKEIDVYVDERLERGDEISSALIQAIEASEISLIIFSKDYAASKWCLEELVKIMECKELNKQTVIPVFYNIDPSDVRHQKGTYEDAFAQHEQKLKDNMEKVQNWRSALNKAANLSGYHYSSNFQNESELIDEIMKDVLKKLSFISPVETKPLIGIDPSISYIESLLVSKPKGVQVIGIWGMGGIGKTTLAQAAFDKLSPQYESCCFLEKVKEETEKNGLSYLLNKLLSELFDEENHHKHCTTRAKFSLIKRKLSRKKVLIVLDDMNTREQLEYLAKESNCLGPGSGVIITSRDKHVLNDNRVDAIHEVKELNFQESLKLFSLNAFNQSHPKMGYEELSERAVVYTKGIPLALKVLGSYFHSRNIETWESALQKLHKFPNGQIQNVLKVSYDGLDGVEKDIFLDIAFFFKGEHKDDVIRVLDACSFYGACGIDSLVDKALITISIYKIIEMHDLIQEMGEQIVREECIKDSGRRSRLKDIEEVYDVLKNNKGTETVEGITLNVSHIRDVELSADTFQKMTNLRILKFFNNSYNRSCNVKLPSGLKPFSSKLRYFHWDIYPLESLPLTFCAEKLVELCMQHSNAKRLWEGVQDLVNLKRINLSGSLHLLELPDFSRAQNLEEVDLSYCKSLCNVHPSILSLHSLVTLSLQDCEELKSLQSEIHLKSLQTLNVDSCSELHEFSLSSEKIDVLDLSCTRIQTLHSTIGRSHNLERLYLSGSSLNILPINGLSCLRFLEVLKVSDCRQVIDKPKLHILFDSLRCLKVLYLDECSNLFELPDNISALSSLYDLSLKGSSIGSLPASIKHILKLHYIDLTNCRRLRFVPEIPPFITHLDADNCTSLETVLTSTTSTLPHNKEEYHVFSFKSCMKLDEHSFSMEFAQFYMKRAVYSNAVEVTVQYPGYRVPEWFIYKQTEASVTIELAPPFDHIKGFLFCSVLSSYSVSQFSIEEFVPSYKLVCKSYFEDGEEVEIARIWTYDFQKPKSVWSHVFLFYGPFDCEDILMEVERRGNDYGTTCNPKLLFEFSVVINMGFDRMLPLDTGFDRMLPLHSLITACGVCPIYASENHNFLHQMELEIKTERTGDIDEQQLSLHQTN